MEAAAALASQRDRDAENARREAIEALQALHLPVSPPKKSKSVARALEPLTQIAASGGKKAFLRYGEGGDSLEEQAARADKAAEAAANSESFRIARKEIEDRATARIIAAEKFRADVEMLTKELDLYANAAGPVTKKQLRMLMEAMKNSAEDSGESFVSDEQLYGEAPDMLLRMTGGGALLHPSVKQIMEAPRRDPSQTYTSYLTTLKARSRMAELMLSRIDERRRLWKKRFEIVGQYAWNKLRYCEWKTSLRAGFESIPSMGGIGVDGGFMVPFERFNSVLAQCLSLDLKRLTPIDLSAFAERVFTALDVELSGAIDYREFAALIAFFRLASHCDPMTMLLSLYRAYEGDMTGGLYLRDFLRVICFLCVSPVEVSSVLSLCKWEALVLSADAIVVKYKVNALGEIEKEADSPEVLAARAREATDNAAIRAAGVPIAFKNIKPGNPTLEAIALVNRDAMAHREFDPKAERKPYKERKLFIMRRPEGEPPIEERMRVQHEAEEVEAQQRAHEAFLRAEEEAERLAEQHAIAMLAALDAVEAGEDADLAKKTVKSRLSADILGFHFRRMKATGAYGVTKAALVADAGASVRLEPGLTQFQTTAPAPADDDPDAPWNRGYDSLMSSRYFNVSTRHTKYNTFTGLKGTFAVPVPRRMQVLAGSRMKITQGAAFGMLGPWEQFVKERTGKTHVPAGFNVIPVPSVIEKFGLPNPIDIILAERLRTAKSGALAQQRLIEAQVRALSEANAADVRPDSPLSPDADELDGADSEDDGNLGDGTVRVRNAVEAAMEKGLASPADAVVDALKLARKEQETLKKPKITDSRRKKKPTGPPDPRLPWPLPKNFVTPTPPVRPAAVIGPFNYFRANTPRPSTRWTFASVPGFHEGLPFPVTAAAAKVLPEAARRARVFALDVFLGKNREVSQMSVDPAAAMESGIPPVPPLQLKPQGVSSLDEISRATSNPMLLSTPATAAEDGTAPSNLRGWLDLSARCRNAEPYKFDTPGQTIAGTNVVISIPASFDRADLATMKRFLTQSPGLTVELQRLRIMRMTHEERSLYLSETIRGQMRRAAKVREALIEEVQAVLALEAFRLRTEAKFFDAWVRVARAQIYERVRVNSLRARRAVRALVIYARVQRIERARVVRAESHYARTFLTRSFLAWRSATTLLREEGVAGAARADALHRAHVLNRVFTAWVELTKSQRAIMHRAAVISHKIFHKWALATARSRARRTNNEVIDARRAERAAAAALEAQRLDDERDFEIETAYFLDEKAKFESDAAETLALAAAAREQAVTERAAQNAERLAKQKEEHVRLRAQKAAALESSFSKKWDTAIASAVSGAQKATLARLDVDTDEAHAELDEGVKVLMAAKDFAAASAPESFFEPDMINGSLHFVCKLDSRFRSRAYSLGRPALSFSRDSWTQDEARFVALAHAIGRACAAARAEQIEKMKQEASFLQQNLAATSIQVVVRAFLMWLRVARTAAAETEIFCDGTGELYYLHAQTGRSSSTPFKFLRSFVPESQPPDFWAKKDAESPSAWGGGASRNGCVWNAS